VSVELPLASPVELPLSTSASLSGTVANESGQPLANALVELDFPQPGEPSVWARTDEAGRFEVRDLLPTMLTATASLGEAKSRPVDVFLSHGQAETISLTVARLGRLRGRIVSEVPGRFYVLPHALTGGDMRHGFRTDEHGSFDQPLMPGRYALYATDLNIDGVARVSIRDVPVEIRAGETTSVEIPVEVQSGPAIPNTAMHPEVGSGLAFDNGPGGVSVGFVMSGCPAALAGVQQGDLVVSIDGEPVGRSLEAFERLRRPRGQAVPMTVRRGGQDLSLTLR
jgi:hypothetical protein